MHSRVPGFSLVSLVAILSIDHIESQDFARHVCKAARHHLQGFARLEVPGTKEAVASLSLGNNSKRVHAIHCQGGGTLSREGGAQGKGVGVGKGQSFGGALHLWYAKLFRKTTAKPAM